MNNNNTVLTHTDIKNPLLTGMGIKNPHQIVRYSIQTSGNLDILRVIYKRESGSLLPSSKKFKFPRTMRVREEDDGAYKKVRNISEISPALSHAMLELDKIVKVKRTHDEQLEVIEDEIHRLEEEMHARITYIKSLVKSLK